MKKIFTYPAKARIALLIAACFTCLAGNAVVGPYKFRVYLKGIRPTDFSNMGTIVVVDPPPPPSAGAPMEFRDPATGNPLTTVAFADTAVGSNSTPLTVTVANTSSSLLTFGAQPGTAAAPVSISATTCAGTLAPAATCTFTLLFSPTAGQAFSGTGLTINSDAVNAPTLAFTGTGTSSSVVQILQGNNETFVHKADGTWWAVGSNGYGQMGTGDYVSFTKFTQIHSLDAATQVLVSGDNTLMKKADGTWWAAGYNVYGELGIGTSTAGSNVFMQVTALTGALKVIPGGHTTFAQKADGSWWATGWNVYGQLGLGDKTNRLSYAKVTSLASDAEVMPSGLMTYVRKSGNTWYSTGYNADGELGLGDLVDRSAFTQVTGITGSSQIALGVGAVYAQKSDGSWWGTGWNQYGQLGLADTAVHSSFTQISGLAGATRVTGGLGHTFAQKADGSWWAAGKNFPGQLGLGDTTNRTTFTQVPALVGVSNVSAINDSTYAFKSDGSWLVTGDNSYGELGLNDKVNRKVFTTMTP